MTVRARGKRALGRAHWVPSDSLARAVRALYVPAYGDVDVFALALVVDPLMTRVARGTGALDVALGRGFAGVAEGDNALRLGYSCLGDYAREVLERDNLSLPGRESLFTLAPPRRSKSRSKPASRCLSSARPWGIRYRGSGRAIGSGAPLDA